MTGLTFHLILHTHWDREWYLPRAGFQARLAPVLGGVLDLLAREPDARFVLDGQTVAAEDALVVRPEWISRVADAVLEKRLEIGPWYVLADEIVPSGESMIRNLLQGAGDAAALGARMDVLHSPDAFGHPGVLPTIAAEFGIANGVVWRGLGRPTGRDCDLYRWRGPDGQEMLTYHLPAAGYEVGSDLRHVAEIPHTWSTIRRELAGRAVTSHIAVFMGADHHAAPPDPVAIRDAIQALESGNIVRLSSLGEYFHAARREASSAPSLSGELRWSYGHTWTLQGTHATRARLKRRHGAVELYLQRLVEPLAALTSLQAGPELSGIVRVAQRALVECQFHDTICGCCGDLVAREQEVRLTSVHAAGSESARIALHALSRHDPDAARDQLASVTPTLLVWNPVARVRGGVTMAEISFFRRDVLVGPPSGRTPSTGVGYAPFALVGADGRPHPVQLLSVTPGLERIDAACHYPDQDEVDVARVAFECPEIGGMGLAALVIGSPTTGPVATSLHAAPRRIENRFLTILITDDDGIELIDRRSGERYPDVLRLVDERDGGDSYTPWITNSDTAASTISVHEPKVIAEGPLVAAIEVRRELQSAGRGTIAARLALMLYADSQVLRVRLEVENGAVDHRLRLRVPVGAGDVAVSGAAFGFARRAPIDTATFDYPSEHPVRTAPAQRYVAAGTGDRGIALFSPGFMEYEWTQRRELFLTVMRSVGELSRSDLPGRPGHAGWPMSTPEAQEAGRHILELAIAPLGEHEADDVAALERIWEDTFLPVQPRFIRDFVGDVAGLDAIGAELVGNGLICSALKAAESGAGIVLRCYNIEPAPLEGRWQFRSAIGSAMLVRADETVIRALSIADSRTVPFTAPARGLVSILIMPP